MLFRADKVNLSNETYVKTLFYYMTSKDLLNKRNKKKRKKKPEKMFLSFMNSLMP